MGWLIACRAVGAVFGVGAVAGPLLGGVLTDGLSWRWCFYVGMPLAAAALIVLQRTLDPPRRRRDHLHMDDPGIVLTAEILTIAAPLGMVALVALLATRERALGRKSGIELAHEGARA